MKTRIAVRFDDICPGMDMEKFERMISIVESFGVKGLLGLVPDNTDPDLMRSEMVDSDAVWGRLKELERDGWSIGMHGTHHSLNRRGRALLTRRRDTEFAGACFKEQCELLSSGKKMLERNGFYTNIFFAPSHSFDKTTIKALRETGFRYMSDGRSRHGYFRCGIQCIPCRVYGLPGNPKGEVTIAIHSNNLDEIGFQKIESFLENHRDMLVSYSELLQIPAKGYAGQRLNELIYLCYFYGKQYLR